MTFVVINFHCFADSFSAPRTQAYGNGQPCGGKTRSASLYLACNTSPSLLTGDSDDGMIRVVDIVEVSDLWLNDDESITALFFCRRSLVCIL